MVVVNDHAANYRPCLVVAHTDPIYAKETCRAFRRLGWDVYQAQTGPEARRLARMLEAELVVLDVNLPEESGWLTCAKLRQLQPDLPVLLVGCKSDQGHRELASFAGARVLLDRHDDPAALLCELRGLPPAA